jgi:pimeloyl-ACP methyl ester carboxylesterase
MSRLSDRFTCRSGVKIYIEDNGQGIPILALHGLGGGAWFFNGLARRLADQYRVIALDLPGTGRSDAPPGRMSIQAWVADIEDLVLHHVGEPVVLVGHSMSTIIALTAGAVWPGTLRATVFVGGLPEAQPEIKDRLALRVEAVTRAGMQGTGTAVAAANFSAVTMERQPEVVGLFERLFDAQDPESYIRCCRILMQASAAGLPARVKGPCLSISGAGDHYAPPELVASFVGEIPDCALKILPDCGHYPFLEQPEAFVTELRSFIERVC